MSSVRQRLQQLLDGELDPSDIADDPTLVSLADRLYGIKIAAVQPVKPRDAFASTDGQNSVTEVAPPTSMLVEVIAPAQATPAQLPQAMPINVGLNLPAQPMSKANPLRFVFGAGLGFVVLNTLGLFSSLFEGLCPTGIGGCRGPEQTRMNLLELYKIGESDGWSYSLLSESMNGIGGMSGGLGIPDLVAFIICFVGLLKFMKRG